MRNRNHIEVFLLSLALLLFDTIVYTTASKTWIPVCFEITVKHTHLETYVKNNFNFTSHFKAELRWILFCGYVVMQENILKLWVLIITDFSGQQCNTRNNIMGSEYPVLSSVQQDLLRTYLPPHPL